MRQLFTTLGFTLTGLTAAFAQTQQGQTLTGGSVGLSLTTQASRPASQFRVEGDGLGYGINASLSRGRFVRDNWLVQYSVGASYSRFDSKLTDGTRTLTESSSNLGNASVGVSLRRYWPVIDRLFVYAGGGLSVYGSQTRQNSEQLNSSPNSTQQSTFTNWTINPNGQLGAMYVLSKRVAAEVNIYGSVMPLGGSGANFGIVLLSGANGVETATEAVPAPQTQKGRWLTGLSVAVNGSGQDRRLQNGNTSDARTSDAQIAASAGQFVRDNVLVGAGVRYQASRSGTQVQPGAPGYSLGFDVFARSYFGAGKLRPFAQAGLSYGFASNGTSESKPQNAGLNASAGLAYLLGDRFIVQSTIGTFGLTYNWLDYGTSAGRQSSVDVRANATTFTNFAVYYAL